MFKLAGHLGKWIWEVEAMPASALCEYIAMYQIEPFGEDRDDLRTGYAAAVSYNLNRQRGQKAMKPSDFLPEFKPRKRQTSQEHEHIFKMFAAAHNASIERKAGK